MRETVEQDQVGPLAPNPTDTSPEGEGELFVPLQTNLRMTRRGEENNFNLH